MRFWLITSIVVSFTASTANGSLVWYIDVAEWQSASGIYSMIDFIGFPVGTQITGQYQNVGVTFTNIVWIHNAQAYSDDWGIFGNDGVRFELDVPHHAVAVDYLGAVSFALYNNGVLVGTIGEFVDIPGPFVGIVSEHPFDEVYLFKPQPPFSNNVIGVDNLYWGMPIPTPGVLPLLALGLLTARRRRR